MIGARKITAAATRPRTSAMLAAHASTGGPTVVAGLCKGAFMLTRGSDRRAFSGGGSGIMSGSVAIGGAGSCHAGSGTANVAGSSSCAGCSEGIIGNGSPFAGAGEPSCTSVTNARLSAMISFAKGEGGTGGDGSGAAKSAGTHSPLQRAQRIFLRDVTTASGTSYWAWQDGQTIFIAHVHSATLPAGKRPTQNRRGSGGDGTSPPAFLALHAASPSPPAWQHTPPRGTTAVW